jgi:hypothetical protein
LQLRFGRKAMRPRASLRYEEAQIAGSPFDRVRKQVWNEIKRQWRGKSSLMDVIRAEKNNSEE